MREKNNQYKSAVTCFARNSRLVAQYRNLNIRMVAGRFISSVHQKASIASSCTMIPSTECIIGPNSKGTEGLPCDLKTQSCPKHHHTNCDCFVSSFKQIFHSFCDNILRHGGIACLFLFIACLEYEKYVFLWLRCMMPNRKP